MRQSATLVPRRYKVNLPEQLADCEANYQYLLRLLPDITTRHEGKQYSYAVGSHVSSESHLCLKLIEQTKYTSLVHLIHYCQVQESQRSTAHYNNLQCNGGRRASSQQDKALDLTYSGDIRLYHDADMAEVVKCQRYRQFAPRYEYPNIDMHQINEKAQMNRFLRDLLSYCLTMGRVTESPIDF